MKIEASMMVQNPAEAGPLAKELEELGIDGIYTYEGQHEPFLPLAVAAQQTSKMSLMTAIAVAFARNPMLLANMAYDLQLLAEGRFILGLGSQIRPHIEKRYSMEWSKPAARMREMVQAIRAIWHSWDTGDKLEFRGEFYTHTIMTPVFNPGPNPHGNPKIFLAGIGPLMTQVVGEVGDGFLAHPFNTPEFVNDITMPALEKGFDISGRKREDFEFALQVMIATGLTEEEFETAKTMVRGQISFYGSTPAYKGVLDNCGLGDLQPKLNALSKEGKWPEMSALITDDIMNAIAVVGSPEEVGAKIKETRAHLADRLHPVVYSGNPQLMKTLADAIRGA